MDRFTEIAPLRRHLSRLRGRRPVVFVPTMGALHDGHRACVERALAVDDAVVVVSIFVNPLQFNSSADLDAYPRDVDTDLALCEEWGAAVTFAPPPRVVYPQPQRVWVDVDDLTATLEGEYRPGHFRGVTTVVAKLFNMVAPDAAVFGQKDAQQALVVRRMVEQLDLPVEILLAATVREDDGLAMSSRNRRLGPDERRHALAIPRALTAAGEALAAGERDPEALEGLVQGVLEAGGVTDVDYAAVRRADDLSPLGRIEGRVILAVAAHAGPVRLIDNRVFDVSPDCVTEDVPLF